MEFFEEINQKELFFQIKQICKNNNIWKNMYCNKCDMNPFYDDIDQKTLYQLEIEIYLTYLNSKKDKHSDNLFVSEVFIIKCDNYERKFDIDFFDLKNYEQFLWSDKKILFNNIKILFDIIKNNLSLKYISLLNISFENCEIIKYNNIFYLKLLLKNSRNKIFYFSFNLNDLINIKQNDIYKNFEIYIIQLILNVLEMFINTERCIYKTYLSYKDAKKRNRTDLVEKYIIQLSEMVKLTCYADILKKKK
jgi:hypothetical protein